MGRFATCGYHCTAKPLSFGKGQSAVHTAAYNAREQLYQEREGRKTRDYSREGEVLFEGIFAPEGAPEWTHDRQELWNRAEAAERQRNGQPARNMIVGLPHELNQQQREWMVKDFAREAFARKGMIADVAMHAPDAKGDERNYHAHILLTMRKLDGDAFAKTKCRDWNQKEQLGEWRAQWAEKGAKALHRAGYPVAAERWRHGHKTYAEQRAAALERGDKEFAESLGNREPTFHKGVKSTALERSGGSNERLERLREVVARNDIRLELAALDGQVQALQQQSLTAARELARNAEGMERAAALQQLGHAAKADARKLWEPPQGQVSAERIFGDTVRGAAQQERADRREKAFWAQQEAWRVSVQEHKPPEVKPVAQGLHVVDKATGAAMGLADFVSNALAGSSAPPEPPERKPNMGAYVSDPAARKEQQLARVAAARRESEAEKAIQRLYDDIDQGRALSASDMHHLNRAQLEVIRMKGDDGMRQIVEAARKRDETYWKTKDGHERDGKYRHDSGRERERD